MFELLRRYQRSFFFVVTVIMIASVSVLGVIGSFESGAETQREVVVGQAIDGSPILRSEVKALSRFLTADRDEGLRSQMNQPNFCNDGVISRDFLQTGLADVLIAHYLEPLTPQLSARLEKARRFQPYTHPETSQISAKAVWEKYNPALHRELTALQDKEESLIDGFSHLSTLYQLQTQLQPELLRRILWIQQQQASHLRADPRLGYEDLSLFGFHSTADWFGSDFVDLVSLFILNASIAAEEKGYQVSLEEAKGDLIHNFQESLTQLEKRKNRPELSFAQHLQMLGFDERTAATVWKKVLLFRRYFQGVGQAAFVDRLPYKDFADYAQETAIVHQYRWATPLKTEQDIAAFSAYLKAVCVPAKTGLPTQFLSVADVEKRHPEFVETLYRAQVAECSKKQIGLRAGIKEVWEWQLDESNFAQLRRAFPSLADGKTREDRFRALERLDSPVRAQADAYAREALVDQNPHWAEEALAGILPVEKEFSVPGNRDPIDVLQARSDFVRIENLEKVGEKQILSFEQARPLIEQRLGDRSTQAQNPFWEATQIAMQEIQKNPEDLKWMKTGDRLLDQLKLERDLREIQRSTQEGWMKEEVFLMLPEQWSSIHTAADGQITFFYLQEKKVNASPILDQLAIGKETLAADAQRYVAERFLETAMKKQAIVIPMQKEIIE